MTNKKLKDLRKGDAMWFWHFTDTTPICVESAKRDGDLMRVRDLVPRLNEVITKIREI